MATKQAVAKPTLTMKYAGGFVQHLGLRMYGGAVPAIAELIANAWDADATRVSIRFPFDQPWTPESEITVRDNGTGMSLKEVNDRYLVLGLDRRAYDRRDTTPGRHRKVLGRKGIGKLAGFGIAHVMEIRTVKNGEMTHFEMDYDAMTRGRSTGSTYRPHVIEYARGVDEKDGTLVTLRHIKLSRAVGNDAFRQRMAERFALLADDFRVAINKKRLAPEEYQFQYRMPDDEWVEEDVPGAGPVSWWLGFTSKPLGGEEAKGVRVLARGKLVQEPFFFNMSGGTTGQFGMQYLSGVVRADFLDEEVDLVATDRASVMWEEPRAAALEQWGQALLRTRLREWSKLRYESKRTRVRKHTPYFDRIDRLPERQRAEVRKLVQPVLEMETLTEERAAEIIELIVRAFENDSFMDLIRAINAADPDAQQDLAELLREWTVQEAVQTAQIVRGRVEVIRKFEEMVAAGVPEKPDMQDFVKANPWLLNPEWEMLVHERSLDRVVAEHFGLEPTSSGEDGERQGGDRLDFFCLADSRRAVVVELKRPGALGGRREIDQTTEYVFYLRDYEETSTDRDGHEVEGLLVLGRLRQSDQRYVRQAATQRIMVTTWRELLRRAEYANRDFLDIVKSRAPADEPRIEALNEGLPALDAQHSAVTD